MVHLLTIRPAGTSAPWRWPWVCGSCAGRGHPSIAPIPLEIGNVLKNYWTRNELLEGIYLPWQLADLDSGQDATSLSFHGVKVLSISTIEHVGHDNEGLAHMNGFRMSDSPEDLKRWVKHWDEAAQLLLRIVSEATEFLVTFPLGLNLRLDDVVAQSEFLRPFSRVLRRSNAENFWQVGWRFCFRAGRVGDQKGTNHNEGFN